MSEAEGNLLVRSASRRKIVWGGHSCPPLLILISTEFVVATYLDGKVAHGLRHKSRKL
jgi:hypothetical protein